MRLSLDRFEGDYAICEDDAQRQHEIHKAKLPPNAKLGDVLRLLSDGTLSIDDVETKIRKARIKALQDRLIGGVRNNF